jgi:arylsulfatase A-like enzyme
LTASLVPATIVTALALLLLDNFTYTVFKFGIVTSQGIQRGIYGFIFLLLVAGMTRWVIRRLSEQTLRIEYPSALRAQVFTSLALLALSIPFGGSLFLAEKAVDPILPNTGSATKRPNILLIGTDGLNADHMSVYGGGKNTTPFLNEFAKKALLAENDFSNANITTGSLTSMLTGKLPTKTHTLYPPDILKGPDAFQHLPGILKKEGYYNVQISVDFYGDANSVNLQDSFVMVDGRSNEMGGLYTFTRQYIPEDAAYFQSTLAKRLSDRLLHIYYIRTAHNPYAQVTRKLDDVGDPEKVRQILETFQDIQQPVFVQVYMMGTHEGMYDSYDDAIRDFDGYVQQVTNGLARMGKLDNTLVIVYSDHAQSNMRNVRLPLILRFPGGEYSRKIVHNTQNLDIPPTILD